jgi:HAD superfamily hydrolase (TIGR01458 family)
VLSDGDASADLEGIELSELDDADVIVLGGANEDFTYPTMNRIFARLMAGATLVGMHRNLYWRTSDGLELDSGAYIAGLEEATGRTAVICGKPTGPYFDAAIAMLGVPRERAIMVGDDIVNDVRGAQVLGIRGVLVQTGKFLPGDLAKVPAAPDDVLATIAELPKLLDAS